jgi:hypothetical protein
MLNYKSVLPTLLPISRDYPRLWYDITTPTAAIAPHSKDNIQAVFHMNVCSVTVDPGNTLLHDSAHRSQENPLAQCNPLQLMA